METNKEDLQITVFDRDVHCFDGGMFFTVTVSVENHTIFCGFPGKYGRSMEKNGYTT